MLPIWDRSLTSFWPSPCDQALPDPRIVAHPQRLHGRREGTTKRKNTQPDGAHLCSRLRPVVTNEIVSLLVSHASVQANNTRCGRYGGLLRRTQRNRKRCCDRIAMRGVVRGRQSCSTHARPTVQSNDRFMRTIPISFTLHAQARSLGIRMYSCRIRGWTGVARAVCHFM